MHVTRYVHPVQIFPTSPCIQPPIQVALEAAFSLQSCHPLRLQIRKQLQTLRGFLGQHKPDGSFPALLKGMVVLAGAVLTSAPAKYRCVCTSRTYRTYKHAAARYRDFKSMRKYEDDPNAEIGAPPKLRASGFLGVTIPKQMSLE